MVDYTNVISMKPKIYFPGTLYGSYEIARPILEPDVEIVVFPEKVLSAEQLAEVFHDVDGAIVTAFEKISRSLIEAAPRLRAISKFGVGIETIDLEAATEHGIPVTNCPGANALGVAEHTLALMFSLLRHVPRLDRMVRQGDWIKSKRFYGADFEGSTLGIIGIGNVGSLVAQRACALGMSVIAYDPYQSAETVARTGAKKVNSLDDLLPVADVVSLHATVTKESRGMLGETEFRKMKPTAYLINAARAALVDQDAMFRALKERWISGAAVDVLEPEPLPLDSPLLQLDNLIITPHHAGTTLRTRERTLKQASSNLIRMLSGDIPDIGLCNPAVRDRFTQK
jgi:D-3-phosphoglycerate dehydrogenase